MKARSYAIITIFVLIASLNLQAQPTASADDSKQVFLKNYFAAMESGNDPQLLSILSKHVASVSNVSNSEFKLLKILKIVNERNRTYYIVLVSTKKNETVYVLTALSGFNSKDCDSAMKTVGLTTLMPRRCYQTIVDNNMHTRGLMLALEKI